MLSLNQQKYRHIHNCGWLNIVQCTHQNVFNNAMTVSWIYQVSFSTYTQLIILLLLEQTSQTLSYLQFRRCRYILTYTVAHQHCRVASIDLGCINACHTELCALVEHQLVNIIVLICHKDRMWFEYQATVIVFDHWVG